MFVLTIEDKSGAVADEFSFDCADLSIGRSRDCDIVLPSNNVSRNHARIFTEGHRCFVEDVESCNGLYVDGRRLEGRTELGPSAQVKVGDFYLHLTRTDESPDRNSPSVRLRLKGKNLGVAGREYALTREVNLIGRGRDASTTIIDSSVSRIHAKIWIDEAGIRVEDLKSANGTFVNDETTFPGGTPVQRGDRLRFGNVEFEVEIPGATGTLYGVGAPSYSTRLTDNSPTTQVETHPAGMEHYSNDQTLSRLAPLPVRPKPPWGWIALGVVAAAVVGGLVTYMAFAP